MNYSLRQSLAGFEGLVSRIPKPAFVALVFVIALIRNGFNFFELNWLVTGRAIDALPQAVNYASWSWGNLLLAKMLGIDSEASWYALHGALTLLALLLPLVLIRRLPRSKFHTFAVYWFLLPVIGSLLMWIGMYDVITVIGAVVIALSRRAWQAALGAVIMSAGNPEQALIAAGAFVLVAHHTELRKHRWQAWVAFVVSALAFMGSRIFIVGQLADDRASLLRSPVESLERLVLDWPTSVWGWNGILWFFVIALLVVSRWKDRVLLVAAIIVLPAMAVFLTYDWDRVYWLVTATSLVALGHRYSQIGMTKALRGAVVATGLIALVIVPPAGGGTFFLISKIGQLLT